ncbi:MAG TPA: hypothetical protein VFF41_05735 [Gallionella sp.]|nr:hypothetical protein [Gallionella sp.]
MSGIGQPERATQSHIISLFRDEPGYDFPATGLTAQGSMAMATATSSKVCSRRI